MDVFVRDVDAKASEKQLKDFLRPYLAPLGVGTCLYHKDRGKQIATITFPEQAMAIKFLQLHGVPDRAAKHVRPESPLYFKGRFLRCVPGKGMPDQFQLESLKREQAQARRRQSRNHDKPKPRDAQAQNTFTFSGLDNGVWDYHEASVTYHSCCVDRRAGTLVLGKKSLVIVLSPSHDTVLPDSYQIRVQYPTIDSISYTSSATPLVSFTLNQSPIFCRLEDQDNLEVQMHRLMLDHRSRRSSGSRVRVCGITPAQAKMAGLCLVYRLQLGDAAQVDAFVKTLRNMEGGPCQPRADTSLRSIPRSVLREQADLMQHLSPSASARWDVSDALPFLLRFQLQRLVLNNFMNPARVFELAGMLEPLMRQHSIVALVEALRRVSRDLPFLSPGVKVEFCKPSTIIRQLDAAAAAFSYKGSIYDMVDKYPHLALVHKVIVTPCNLYLEGPELESKNRVLRKYPLHADHFVRVSFLDENLQSVAYETKLDRSEVFQVRFKNIINGFIDICGRSYRFLGFSHSSLRTHQCWFMAPFYHDDTMQIPQNVIASLGDFSTIRSPARCAARIGQAFSDTTDSISLGDQCLVTHLDDVERNGRTFTDGVGTISAALLDRVWENFSRTRKQHATVLQIRQAGAKGMVSLDPRLEGERLCLRPSMVKFRGSKDSDLEICGAGYRALPLYLNQQLIKILEDLGSDPEAFLALQQAALTELQDMLHDPPAAARYLENNIGSTAIKMPTLIRKLHGLGLNFRDDHFLRRAVDVVALTQLRDIKYRARIPVQNGYTLLGVADTTDFLKPNQVHVAVRDRRGQTSNLVGWVLVTRAPALHPGDVQLLEAVEVPHDSPLRALHNCLIFSVRGERDTPSCLSGGDLDGDLYNVLVEPSLWPKKMHAPADYPRLPPIDIKRPVEVADITEFFVRFMETDQLGHISNVHKQAADQKTHGTMDPACIKLAEMASTAVDYSKTGIAVEISEMPKDVNKKYKPDFMARAPNLILDSKMGGGSNDAGVALEDVYLDDDDDDPEDPVMLLQPDPPRQYFYESKKILGRLYREVDEDTFLPKLHESDRKRSSEFGGGGLKPGASLMQHVWGLVETHCKLVQQDHYEQLALQIKGEYELCLIDTMYYFSSHPRQPLTELEVFSGVILGRAGGIPNKRTRDTNMDMKGKFDRDVNYFADWIIRGNPDEQAPGDMNLFEDEADEADEAVDYERRRQDVAAYERLARSLAVLRVAMQRPGDVVPGTGQHLQSFKYVAASVCLRQLERVFGGDWHRRA